MALITKHISVDVASENIFQGIIAKQYDSDSRFLKVRLTNEGEPIDVVHGSQALINARRPDEDAKAFAGVVNDDGTITVPLTYWMLEQDGQVECDITVIDSDGRKLTSTSFTIKVEAAAYGGTDVSEDENTDILMNLIVRCEEAATAGISQTEALETAYSNILKGRNLLQKTNQGLENWAFDSYDNASDYTLEAVTTEDGTNAVKLTLRSTNPEWSVLMYSLKDTLRKLKPNTRYTLSFDMKTDIAHSYELKICTMGVNGQLNTEHFYAVSVGDESWEHFVWHLTTNSLSELEKYADSIGIYFNFREGTGYRIIKNLKLEKGYTATEWCQSPEEAIESVPDFTEQTADAFDVAEQFVVDRPIEEWITIGEYTATEETPKHDFATDIHGNPFLCKKIMVYVAFPQALAANTNYGIKTNIFELGGTIFTNFTRLHYYADVAIGAYVLVGSESYDNGNWLGNGTQKSQLFPLGADAKPINYVLVSNWSGMFPIGTQIKVWGLKA